jgi:hypothetical protein
MLEALIAGRAEPATRTALVQRRRRSKIAGREPALTGIVHDHHRQSLAMPLAHIALLAEVMVAASGLELSRFETAPRLAAWAGAAPGGDARVGEQHCGKTRQGNRPRRAILTQLAHAAVPANGTDLSAL